MAGEVASAWLSRMAVPVLYYMAQKRTRNLGTNSTETTKKAFVGRWNGIFD